MDSGGGTRLFASWFEVRGIPLRLLVLLVPATGCLFLLTGTAGGIDWAIALSAVVVAAAGVRWPFIAALLTSGLLLLGFEFGDSGPIVAKVAAGFALTELAARREGREIYVAAGALGLAYLLHPTGEFAANGYRAVVMAGAPLLLGGLLRTIRGSAERARRQTLELAERRDIEVAAARALERTAIARELHDLIAHHVSSTVLRVGVARHALPDAPPPLLEVLDEIHASGRETLRDLRRLVSILRDPAMTEDAFIAPADLPAAVLAVAERAGQLGVTVDCEVEESIGEIDAMSALTLLRLTQEGIANVAEHAGPGTTARLRITVNSDHAAFLLCDNGSGAGQPASGNGLGLVGLRERVELLGGEFAARSHGPGWQLTATLPIGVPVP
ncbi:histidine kinase [Nocardia sp. NPDC005978]|uniref:sensor histidine kinase n=1 Tax=Nocardia sp. NPDC005978 TaxID=3156725 RepID=UPI0033B6254B